MSGYPPQGAYGGQPGYGAPPPGQPGYAPPPGAPAYGQPQAPPYSHAAQPGYPQPPPQGYAPPAQGYPHPPQGYAAPYGAPPQQPHQPHIGFGHAAAMVASMAGVASAVHNQAPQGYGAPPPQHAGYGAPPHGAQPGYGAPQPGYGAQAPPPHPGYSSQAPPPHPGYGSQAPPPHPGYGAQAPPPQPGYGAQAPGYGAATAPAHSGYSAPPAAHTPYGAPPGGVLPPQVQRPAPPPPTATASTASYGGDDDDDLDAAFASMAINEPVTHGTCVEARGFNAEEDSKVLRKAMKGLGCDCTAVANVVGYRTTAQRQEIKLKFKTMYGKDLEKMLKSELKLKPNFRDLVLAAMLDTPDRDATWLRNAMQGVGTDERCLIEILSTRSGEDIMKIRSAYQKLFERDLESDLKSETSGHFKRLLVSLAQGNRPPPSTPVNEAKARTDAQALYKAGVGRLGTDESKFNEVLCSRSFPQLRLTFEEYAKISKRDIIRSIKSEMSGDLRHGMLAVAKCVVNRHEYFAARIYKSMKGMGTDDRALIRNVVSRCEIDMVEIKECFYRMYSKSMEDWIKSDTGGDYRRCLLALVGGGSR